MTILINTGGCEPVNVDALRNDIRRRLNEGVDERNYQVWSADAAHREAVSRDVLGGVLTHLATALPRMDAAVVDRAGAVRAGPGRAVRREERLLATVRASPGRPPPRS